MNKRDELTTELIKNKADKIICEKELINEKNKFIDEVRKRGVELKTVNDFSKPIPIKKPLKLKIREFFNRIGRILNKE